VRGLAEAIYDDPMADSPRLRVPVLTFGPGCKGLLDSTAPTATHHGRLRRLAAVAAFRVLVSGQWRATRNGNAGSDGSYGKVDSVNSRVQSADWVPNATLSANYTSSVTAFPPIWMNAIRRRFPRD